MQITRMLTAVLCVMAVVTAARADESAAGRIAARAEALRPSADLLKWQRIPWMTDLAEALKVAKEEGRPVLLWGSDDEPLERC
ncbi:MAG TPA: hypothetical protein VMN36_10165 [Verrucomicrobiales bacterium]|nr:hypothetical protein [Verrucomicrobiales bacterium]